MANIIIKCWSSFHKKEKIVESVYFSAKAIAIYISIKIVFDSKNNSKSNKLAYIWLVNN